MNTSLYWAPIVEQPKTSLPDELMYALRHRFGNPIHNRSMNRDDYWYLQGLSDAGVRGADELWKLIEKYGSVRLTEE